MAKTNVKKKKKSSYDEKIIMIIGASVSALIVAIAAIFFLISYFGSYVAKVDGKRIYKYEYQYYLDKVIYEMQEEAIDDGKLDEDADSEELAAFWTDAKKKEAAVQAMEEVVEWKAEYILAKKEGFKLSYKERNERKQNLTNMLGSYYQQYSSYYSYDEFVKMYLGMEMDDYLEIAIQDEAITNYKTELKKAYTVEEKELKEIYDKNPDDYRFITLRILGLSLPDEIAEVKDPGEKDTSKMTETEKKEYEAAQKAYEEYKKKVDERKAEIAKIEERLEKMVEQLNTTGKFNEAADDESDAATGDASDASDASDSEEESGYKDATLADIIKKEGKMFTDTAGVKEINALTSSGYDTLDDYALTMQWADEARTKIQSVKKGEDGKETVADGDGEKVGDITYSKYVLLEDDKYMYVVRCEGIEDYNNSEDSSEGAEDSVKSTIKKDLFEERAVAELEKKVADAGDKFKVEKKRQESIDKIVKEQAWG